jgi:hypothetical protein
MVADALPDGSSLPDPAIARLRALTGRLDALTDLPVEQHAAVYDEVHAVLVESLESLDEG